MGAGRSATGGAAVDKSGTTAPLVRRAGGAGTFTDPRTHGPTDPRTHGPTDPRTHGPTDPRTYSQTGSTARWPFGPSLTNAAGSSAEW